MVTNLGRGVKVFRKGCEEYIGRNGKVFIYEGMGRGGKIG